MKKYLLGLCVLLAGCSPALVYKPAPLESLAMQQAVRASGVLIPKGLYFTLISHYQEDSARVVILAEPALKLADLTVSQEQIYVHYKEAHVPVGLVRAWGKLVQAQFLTPCPSRQIAQSAEGMNETFELEVTGGVCQ
ncbi:MAG: hypothetical protein IJ876_02605 [Elusimicrobiaceae bacterium]|nr:hypothetical protein [Elusimicrobiaceae bacterium]